MSSTSIEYPQSVSKIVDKVRKTITTLDNIQLVNYNVNISKYKGEFRINATITIDYESLEDKYIPKILECNQKITKLGFTNIRLISDMNSATIMCSII